MPDLPNVGWGGSKHKSTVEFNIHTLLVNFH